MKPGQNCYALDATFDDKDPRGAFETLQNETNSELQEFINYYSGWALKFKWVSIPTRVLAVVSGFLAAAALNPAISESSLFLMFLGASDPNDLLLRASSFAVLAGLVLSVDGMFAFTRKYTNWTALSYELGVNKATFNIAFSKLYVDVDPGNLTEEAFAEARLLAQQTVKEFKDKRWDETKDWATNLQTVMESLRRNNVQVVKELRTASSAALEESEKADREAKSASKLAGLTIKVSQDANRGSNQMRCIVMNESGSVRIKSYDVRAGASVGGFFKKDRYAVKLEDDAGKIIASVPITLGKDLTITI